MGSNPLLAALMTIGAVLAAPCAPADDATTTVVRPIDAIWKVRSVTFRYSSPNTYYYCDTLHRRVTDIMLAVGASEVMNVKVKCSVDSLINNATVRIVAGIPIEATHENLVRETTFDARTALIAEARNWTLATPETVHRFRAEHKDVSFANFASSDCDLLHAMSEQVFPRLGIEIKHTPNCSGASPLPNLTVSVLKSVELP